MSIRLQDLKKIESSPPSALSERDENERMEVIVKVREPDYVPPGVIVRAQIAPVLFTSEVPAKMLAKLERDPQVVSVSISKKLRMIE